MNAPLDNVGLSVLRERIRLARVPRARRGESLVLATWNVRELGKSPRRAQSLRYIAELIRSFDLCVVIELREDLSDLRGILRLLGTHFHALYSECIRDAGGNRERIAFVYDTRLVEFTGMASHLTPPREKKGDEYLARVSWWRPPYLASFRSGRFDFVVAAAHIRWGSGGVGPRAHEIAMLADWATHYAAAPRTTVRDLLLVGDFNVPSTKSECFEVLTERGFAIPSSLANVFGTDLAKGKRYDQILAVPTKLGTMVQFACGGAIDFYAGAHRALYPRLNKTEFTYELSDHLPLWVELACR